MNISYFRVIYTECSAGTCPMGENCGNQRIQKHEWAPGLEKFDTSERGFGVKTNSAIKNGKFTLIKVLFNRVLLLSK